MAALGANTETADGSRVVAIMPSQTTAGNESYQYVYPTRAATALTILRY
jgi:hypothetical protein